MDAADVIEDETMASASDRRDPAEGPVTPSRLADAQALVAAADENVRRRNELVRRAAEAGWNDDDIWRALNAGAPISTFQVSRIRRGGSSGRQHEYDKRHQTRE